MFFLWDLQTPPPHPFPPYLHLVEDAESVVSDCCEVMEFCVVGQLRTDWVGLIDEWAGRFFNELDYEREAVSAATFAKQMESLDGIMVPEVCSYCFL